MSIQNMESPVTIMGTVHGQLQPNLQTAFNLQLDQNTNNESGNMSMSMSMNNNNQSMQ